MPQAPLPAPAARTQPTELIRPIVAGTPTPPSLPTQLLPDVVDRIRKGVETADWLTKIPREASETVMQKMMQNVQEQLYKATMAKIKAIQSDKTMTEQAKSDAIRSEILKSGYGAVGNQGTQNFQVPVGVSGTEIYRRPGTGGTSGGEEPSTESGTGLGKGQSQGAPNQKQFDQLQGQRSEGVEPPVDHTMLNSNQMVVPTNGMNLPAIQWGQPQNPYVAGNYPPAANFLNYYG